MYQARAQFPELPFSERCEIARAATGHLVCYWQSDMYKVGVACVLSVAACTSSSGDSSVMTALRTEQPGIDSAHFTTASSIAQNPAPDVDVTVTGDAAQKIFAATIALPEMPQGDYGCPADWGITYTLEFSGGQHAVTATIEPSGCERASLSIEQGSVWVATAPDYWTTLANALGVVEAKLYPYDPPS
jgi:hypothetical protein